jgi:hypothetical protein
MSTLETDENGNRRWYNGQAQLHRELGPAIEYADGSCAWYLNGQRHRTDGPAVEDDSGYRAWFWHGEELTFAEWLNRTTRTPQHQTLLRLRWA